MTATERLLRDAETCQRDVLFALADASLEAGDEVRAAGYRWLGGETRWPACRWEPPDGSRRLWFWVAGHEQAFGHGSSCCLPEGAFNRRAYHSSPRLADLLQDGARAVGEWIAGAKA